MKNANTINILKPNSTSAKKKREYAPMIDVEKGINEIAAKKKMFIHRKGKLSVLTLMNSW